MKNRISFTVLFLIVFLSKNIYSQWSTDPTVNNPICILTSEQGFPTTTSDGSGGAIITWHDNRNGNQDIYAQRINSSGDTLWTTAPGGGVAICTDGSDQVDPSISSDGSGGAIITWVDLRNNGTTNYDIYAQRINSSGATLWATDGVPICTQASSSYNPTIASDGSGGAIITWWDLRNGNNPDIYAQKINSSGVIQWTGSPDGVAICTATGEQRYPKIISDGSGGAIITWYDERNGSSNPDIFAQRIDASGTTLWTADGVSVCTQASYQEDPQITIDGSGGAIITWWDERNNNTTHYDIYAQRINSSGAVQWTGSPDGVAICTEPTSNQQYPAITSDGSGGAIITWVDDRNYQINSYSLSDIYAQRINSSGATLWASDVQISTNFAAQYYPAITGDGAGGAIVTWYDYRNNNNDIYASKVSSDGVLPVELTTFTSTQGKDNTVVLNWTTATEVHNYGFEVERKVVGEVSVNWNSIGFLAGAGTTNAPKEYSFIDKNFNIGRYSYRLKQIDRDGQFKYSQEVEVTVREVPKVFALEQNFPNPFNPSTMIGYQLPAANHVSLKVYDVIGRVVATLVDEIKEAGTYTVHFDGSKLSSGIYFARLQSGDKVQMKKMQLLK